MNRQQDQDDTKFVCHGCIGDDFLANEVTEQSHPRQCTYCHERRQAIPLEELADLIHEALQEHYELTASEPEGIDYVLAKEGLWHRPGWPVEDVIGDMAGISSEIASDVTERLANLHDDPWAIVKDQETALYDDEALYEERGADDLGFHEEWDAFHREIRSHARFFSTYAEKSLELIFGELSALTDYKGRHVIREIAPGGEDNFIWRARKAESAEELKAILGASVRELGPPPTRRARNGRMNAAGIPVFYGAFEADTCVAEVRAPVGSHVVVAKFEVLRPLRLLDFDALKEVYVAGSHFDPGYAERLGRASFLRSLVQEMSRPVMPQDEVFEYIATQVVAEYLANKVEPRLDGIIFRSSQTGSKGSNVVLFNHACGVELSALPEEAKVTVDMYFGEENTEDESNDYIADQITILETMPPEPTETVAPTKPIGTVADAMRASLDAAIWPDQESDDGLPTDSPALRLNMDTLVVLYIKSLEYDTKDRNVFRSRRTRDEEPEY